MREATRERGRQQERVRGGGREGERQREREREREQERQGERQREREGERQRERRNERERSATSQRERERECWPVTDGGSRADERLCTSESRVHTLRTRRVALDTSTHPPERPASALARLRAECVRRTMRHTQRQPALCLLCLACRWRRTTLRSRAGLSILHSHTASAFANIARHEDG